MTQQSNGTLQLALAVSLLALIWLLALPWLAARPPMAARIQWLDDHRIDPSAMYYTELEAAQPILHRLERTRK